MMPRGSHALGLMRIKGYRPGVPVWVKVGDYPKPDWDQWQETQLHPVLAVCPEDNIERLDFRCVAGLEVTLFAPQWNERAAQVLEALKAYASEIAVLSPEFEADIGWFWIKGMGDVNFDDRHKVKEADQWQTH